MVVMGAMILTTTPPPPPPSIIIAALWTQQAPLLSPPLTPPQLRHPSPPPSQRPLVPQERAIWRDHQGYSLPVDPSSGSIMPIQTTLISMKKNRIDRLVVEGNPLGPALVPGLSDSSNKSNNCHRLCHHSRSSSSNVIVGDEARPRKRKSMKSNTSEMKEMMLQRMRKKASRITVGMSRLNRNLRPLNDALFGIEAPSRPPNPFMSSTLRHHPSRGLAGMHLLDRITEGTMTNVIATTTTAGTEDLPHPTCALLSPQNDLTLHQSLLPLLDPSQRT